MSDASSTKPYLIRAIYEWCTDNGFTPYIAVQVDEQTVVPREYVKNSEIVLNISSLATSKLSLGNEYVDFQARFGGVARSITVPIANISAVYARENGHGMAFEVSVASATGKDAPALPAPDGKRSTPRPSLSSVDGNAPTTPPGPDDDGPRGKPKLTIVKS